MEKHETIKRAYDTYPIGTKFKSAFSGDEFISNGKFVFYGDSICLDIQAMPFIYESGLGKWAEIISEKPERKFIMKSEDGVDLYSNDSVFTVRYNRGGECKWNNPLQKIMSLEVSNVLLHEANAVKGFYSKEAAEKWVEEQNKPKEVEVRLFSGGYALICKYDIEVYQNDSKIHMKPSDIEDIHHVLTSL